MKWQTIWKTIEESYDEGGALEVKIKSLFAWGWALQTAQQVETGEMERWKIDCTYFDIMREVVKWSRLLCTKREWGYLGDCDCGWEKKEKRVEDQQNIGTAA